MIVQAYTARVSVLLHGQLAYQVGAAVGQGEALTHAQHLDGIYTRGNLDGQYTRTNLDGQAG